MLTLSAVFVGASTTLLGAAVAWAIPSWNRRRGRIPTSGLSAVSAVSTDPETQGLVSGLAMCVGATLGLLFLDLEVAGTGLIGAAAQTILEGGLGAGLAAVGLHGFVHLQLLRIEARARDSRVTQDASHGRQFQDRLDSLSRHLQQVRRESDEHVEALREIESLTGADSAEEREALIALAKEKIALGEAARHALATRIDSLRTEALVVTLERLLAAPGADATSSLQSAGDVLDRALSWLDAGYRVEDIPQGCTSLLSGGSVESTPAGWCVEDDVASLHRVKARILELQQRLQERSESLRLDRARQVIAGVESDLQWDHENRVIEDLVALDAGLNRARESTTDAGVEGIRPTALSADSVASMTLDALKGVECAAGVSAPEPVDEELA